MKRLIILVALIFTTTAQADWYKDNTTTLDLRLDRGNLKAVTAMARSEGFKCKYYLALIDASSFNEAEWKKECYGFKIVSNTINTWQTSTETKEQFMTVAYELEHDISWRQDLKSYIQKMADISSRMKLLRMMLEN